MKVSNMRELNRLMNDMMKAVLTTTAMRIEKEINKFLTLWYQDYEPKQYRRTYQFLNSCVRADVEKLGSKYVVSVYIGTDDMRYFDYSDSYADEVNPYDVFINANRGLHGIKYAQMGNSGVRFWDDAMEQIKQDKIIANAFKNWLIAFGFNVK